jgi:hypothetical protein
MNRDALKIFSGFFWVDARDKTIFTVRIIATHPGMKLASLARDALGDNLRIFVNQN